MVNEREFQTVCKTLLFDGQGVTEEAFLSWWQKQALPYRKRAIMVGNGLSDKIKNFDVVRLRSNMRICAAAL